MSFEQALAISVPAFTAIGLLISFLGHRILKSNAELSAAISRQNAELAASLQAKVKLAEFRQKWIDELRIDMAEYQSEGMLLHRQPANLPKVLELGARIKLRMNPRDENFERLSNCIIEIRTARNSEEALDAMDPYLAVSQDILKAEWDVLRKDLKKLDFDSLHAN